MDLEELIQRIGFIRTRAKLTARKLSLEIGKSSGYIHLLETARNFAPTFETLNAILEVCNISTEEFFYYDISAYKNDKQIIELLKNTKDEEKKAAIISLLKR